MNRIIKTELRLSYIDQEVVNKALHDSIAHYFELDGVREFKSINAFLAGLETYEVTFANFMFIIADRDLNLLIDGTKSFAVKEFLLVQSEIPFSFKLSQLNGPLSLCTTNFHCIHCKLT